MKRKISAILVLVISILCASIFAACSIDFSSLFGNSTKHIHDYSTEWSSDGTYHWRECLNGGCNEKVSDKDPHYDFDNDGDCDVCFHSLTGHVHNYQWVDNLDGTHRQHCNEAGCGRPDKSVGDHVYDENDRCVCGAKKPLVEHIHDYQWFNNGDGTHRQHCGVSGCLKPDLLEGPHDYDENGECVCGAREPVEGHEHVFTLVPEEAPTCMREGNKAYYTCLGCDKLFLDADEQSQTTMDDIILGVSDHVFEDYYSDRNATCLKDGTETALCKNCRTAKDQRIEEGSALGHDYVTHDGKEASCFAEGWKPYETCSRCDYSSYEAIPEIGHHTMQNGICTVCGFIDWTHDGLNLIELCNTRYGYEYLGTMSNGGSRQALYEQIDEAVTAVHNDVTTDYTADAFTTLNFLTLNLTADDAVAVWKTYNDDNPLYYWFKNTVAYSGSSIYLYVDDDYLSGGVRAECNKVIYQKIQEYMAYAEGETSAYQVALAFHDKIIYAVDYAYSSPNVPEDAKWAHSIAGVFEERGAVCEGYAKTFQLLLNLRSIENVMVTGQAGGEAHAWNLIRLDDGEWYWCDLTWDDQPSYTWGVIYRYFCVNDWQGADWVDGGSPTGEETGEGIGGSPAGCGTFVTQHTAYNKNGLGIKFLYDLPARSPHIYQGESGELRVRDTFDVGDMQFAVTGYHTVQVTKVPASGDIVIPESVIYNGESYTIMSLGVIGGTKLFGAGYLFGSEVTSVTLPSTVIYIWGWVFYRYNADEIKFNGSLTQWNNVIKVNYWKRSDKSLTVRCVGGDVTV